MTFSKAIRKYDTQQNNNLCLCQLSYFMLNIIMLSVVMLNVVLLNVVLLNVMVPPPGPNVIKLFTSRNF
jgi:hypothetical protein